MSEVKINDATTVAPSAGSINFDDPPIEVINNRDLVYHQLCLVDEFDTVEGKPFHVNGTHLSVFKYQDKFYAVDNRCPHMGYPMSQETTPAICHFFPSTVFLPPSSSAAR